MDWHLVRSLVAEIHAARRSVVLLLYMNGHVKGGEWNGWSLPFARFLDFHGFRWLLQEALYWFLINFLSHPKSLWSAVVQRASIVPYFHICPIQNFDSGFRIPNFLGATCRWRSKMFACCDLHFLAGHHFQIFKGWCVVVFVLRCQISRQILCLRWRQGQNDGLGIWLPLLLIQPWNHDFAIFAIRSLFCLWFSMLWEFWVLPVLPIDWHFAVNQT